MRPRIRYTLIAVGITFAVVLLRQTPLGRPVESVLTAAATPLRAWLYGAGRSLVTSDVIGDLVLEEEQAMREERDRLLVENAELRTELEEYAQVRSQLDALSSFTFPLTSGRVIGTTLLENTKTYIIDRGTDHGVGVGMPVTAGPGVFIGTITEVSPRTSTVLMVNDTQSSVSAEVQNDARSTGIVEGEVGLSAELHLIPQDEPLDVGMTIVTAGLEDAIPNGLLIGTVATLTSEEQSLFQSATIKLPLDITHANIVTVLRTTLKP